MKGKLTKLQFIAVIGLAIILVVGGGAYYYVYTLLDAAQTDLNDKIALRDKLVHSPIFPSDLSFKTLKEDNELLRTSIEVLTARLVTPDNKLRGVVQKNPILFKQDLADEEKKLTDLAKNKGVQIPPNFPFGFGRYFSITPLDKDTVFLGKQVIAIDELVTQLFQSQISRLLSVRRSYDEIPQRENSQVSDPGNEMLKGRVVEVAKGIYSSTPYQLEFMAKPAALRTFLNRLLSSPYIFIVRSVQISSTKLDPVTLDELSRQANGVDPNANADGSAASTAKPPIHAMGFEDVQVVVRVDLIEWLGHAKDNGHSKPAPKKS